MFTNFPVPKQAQRYSDVRRS